MTMPATAMRSLPWLLFITLLLCPFHLRRSSTATYYALGLVNVAPITRLMAPWAVRNHGRYTALFNVPEATTVDAPLTTAAPGGPSDATQAAAAESSPKSSPKAASPQQDTAQTASQKVPLLEGVWVPPSQNVAQRRGKIFSIQQPQDLLDFVIEDERLSVVKVYASWCKTCKVFDVRYRKLASQFGDKYDSKTGTEITQMGRVRFAEMQFDNPNNEEMCKVLNATKLPYIFLYKGSKGKMKEFQCSPTKFKMLTDAVNEYADPVVGDSEMNRELEKLPVLNRDDLEESPQDGNATIAAQSMSSNGEDTIDGLKQQRVRNNDSNWEDEFSSSRNNAEVTGDKAMIKPPWQENAEYWAEQEALEKMGNSKKEQSSGDTVGNMNNDGGNTVTHIHQQKSTDDFKKPYEYQDEDVSPPPPPPRRVDGQTLPPSDDAAKQTGWVPDWFGSDTRVGDGQKLPPKKANASFNPSETRQSFQMSSTDDFRKPHGTVAPGRSSGGSDVQHPPPQPQARAHNPDANRHSFQTSSNDDFRKPHGMPSNMEQQQRPPPQKVFKASFQTSSTDDFKRSSDGTSGEGAPQQPSFQKPNRSDNPAWKNSMGQDAYGSTQQPEQSPPAGGEVFQNLVDQAQNVFQSIQPPKFTDAMIIDNNIPQQQPSQPAAPVTDFEERDQKMETASVKSSSTMVRNIKWPLVRDPPGVSPEYPLLATRVFVTMFATLSTQYLHLYSGNSPVLASSAMTLLVSTCFDRRLGQAALCGSFAGMSGGHLTPDLSMALLLGAVTSACYEVLININNACLGIGGRLGATAFLATSIMARYRGIGSAGRKLRRGLWKSGAGPSSIAVSMVLYHVLGAVSTILLREYSDDSGAADPVRASSVIGLLGSLFLKDPTAILAVYGGSFVGMSLPSRLMNGNAPGNARAGQPQTAVSLLASFAGAGAMAGLFHAISIHSGYWNGGWGGKAGLCAFAGCWVYRGFGNVAQFINKRRI
eukprot:CAMPEP_0202000412 /NCGR_PEP_ID=MMETSP0905-20130828/6765_1 /ASSEMBLY_ACC=CAM_ASM_000554 /TAXON_ID=420261 /ORGANISM="Thalassiosira antarctica, Strain CCMP982" /LENGTH=981 /DNA_ID=CAMNT_0048556881 /DNA_START=139 /DNA_END=3084 /DNA_ORIENTATION=-